MNRIVVFLFVLLLPLSLLAQDITGFWTTFDKEGKPESVVEIYVSGDKYFGKVVKLVNASPENPHPLCVKCKDNLKNKPIIGLVIIQNIEKVGNIYARGTILNPKNGNTYALQLSFKPDNDNILIVKGSSGPFSKKEYWKRLK